MAVPWRLADADHDHTHAHEDLAPHGGRYADILDAIGHTPLVEIPRMSPNPDVRIFAKLEMLNPTGSVKDRVAKYLIEDLEARGLLHEDSIILEPTSGNTGIALAMIGRRKGYRVALVMPDNVTNERRQMAALFGAEVIDSPGALGSNGAIALAKHLVAKDERFVMPYQYGNPANPLAHYETTGPEILADCPEIDVFVAGLGTGGTLMGVSRYLREHKPGVRIVAAEPLPGEQVQGLRSLDEGFIPEIFDPTLIDAKYLVSNRDAHRRRCASSCSARGSSPGPSCGAVLVAAAREADADGPRARSSRCSPTAAGSTSRPARSRPTSTRWRTPSKAASTGGDAGPSGPGDGATAGRLIPGADRPRPGRVPERGLRADRRRPRGGGRRPRAALRADAQRGGLAVPLRDPPRRPVPADGRDRRRRRGVLGDRPLAHPHAGGPVADRHRARVLPRRAVRARVAQRRRGGPATGATPSVRAWRIVDGHVHEVALDVIEG